MEFWKVGITDFGTPDVSKVDAGPRTLRSGTCRIRRSTCAKREAGVAAYLRAAQAYMLISMPTGTSTILGVFQAILALLINRTNFVLGNNLLPFEKFAS